MVALTTSIVNSLPLFVYMHMKQTEPQSYARMAATANLRRLKVSWSSVRLFLTAQNI